jgi:hypothetical protein
MARFTGWGPDLEDALAEPFPPALVSQKKIKGSSIAFVGWIHYVARLNSLVGPGWSMGEPILREVGGKLVMGIPLTIFGVTRTNFGDEQEEHGNPDEVVDKDTGEVKLVNRDYGSAATNAFAQAFKRSCCLFGLGLSMYDKTGSMSRERDGRRREADEAHVRMLAFIREVGGRCEDDVEFRFADNTLPIKTFVRDNWQRIKQHADYASDVVRAIEAGTGERFRAA